MTGLQFERYIADRMSDAGYWVLNISRNNSGAQPFDIVAIQGSRIWLVDCKVSNVQRFPLDRVEPNQWVAFEQASRKTNANVGLLIWYDNSVWFMPFVRLLELRKNGKRSFLVDRDKAIVRWR